MQIRLNFFIGLKFHIRILFRKFGLVHFLLLEFLSQIISSKDTIVISTKKFTFYLLMHQTEFLLKLMKQGEKESKHYFNDYIMLLIKDVQYKITARAKTRIRYIYQLGQYQNFDFKEIGLH